MNRNPELFRQATEYARGGGRIPPPPGAKGRLPGPDAGRALNSAGVDISRVTVSSDAGGSMPSGGVAPPSALFNDFKEIIRQLVLPAEGAVRLFSENAAKALKLYPKKGVLR
jgi:beta-aspartyl-dipeptidase (metallo-type)